MIVRRFNCTISTSSRLSQSAWMFATVRRVAASIGGGSSSFFPMVPCLAPRAELAWRRLSYWRDGCALSTRGWKRLPGSGGAESCRCAAALWREAARCERLRAVTTRLHDGTIAQGRRARIPVLPSVLLTASSMPAWHLAFSYHFNHSAGSATPCAVLVSWPSAAADAQPLGRAPPDPLLSAKRVPRGIRHKNTETGAQCAAPRCALAI